MAAKEAIKERESSDEAQEALCHECHGSGSCRHCFGRGHRGYGFSHEFGSGLQKGTMCDYCGPPGTGRCGVCSGKGRLD